MATIQQIEAGFRKAYESGNMEYARVLGAELVRARKDLPSQIPGIHVPGTEPPPRETSVGEKLTGAGETALTLATGATGGTVGMIGGTLKGLAEQILSGNFGTPEAARLVEESAMSGAGALTYAPRGAEGQKQTAAAGGVLQQLIPVAPIAPALAPALQSARAAQPVIAAEAARVAQPAIRAGQRVVEATKEAIGGRGPTVTPGSAGAAAVDIGTLRQAKAEELPIPVKLTEGQKTRDFGQVRFEREAAKDVELGAPLRERFAEQNQKLAQNLDAFIDMTGSEAPDLRSIGIAVDKALRERAARDKVKIRTLYKEAEKAGEMESPVTLQGIVDHLVESAPEAEVANVLKATRAKAIQLGIASEAPDGSLIANPVPLKTAELFRRSINNATNTEPTNIRQASIMKGLIDDETATAGGQLYKRARAARARYSHDYENVGVVKNILNLKRGSEDRAIALEDVLRRSIIDPSASLDSVRQVRRLLQTEGENGMQAWRELQGGTLRYIKDEALKNVAPDQFGNKIVSPAQLDRVITQLDKNGKLDFIFGKKGAEQLRTINDVAKDVLTVPPGTVNTSNTATVLSTMIDLSMTAASGIPAPIATSFRLLSKNVRDSKTRAKVKRALGE